MLLMRDGYHQVNKWFHDTVANGAYNGYDVYLGEGITYVSSNYTAKPCTFWSETAAGAWHYQRKRIEPDNWSSRSPDRRLVHRVGTYAGWRVYDSSAGWLECTQDSAHYWRMDSSGAWNYYAGSNFTPVTGLGATTLVADGNWHTWGNNWSYQISGGIEQWDYTALNANLFEYNTTTGQWSDESVAGGWQPLGPSGMNSSFLGDGMIHKLDNVWHYQFANGIQQWVYTALNAVLFEYNTATGQWSDQSVAGGGQPLGPADDPPSFCEPDGSPTG